MLWASCKAEVGLWQILARQGQIREANLNDSWRHVIEPFAAVAASTQLLDAGRASLEALMQAAAGRPDLSQSEFIALLAGPDQKTAEGKQVKQFLGNRIRAVMYDQRLVSFDTILALADGLKHKAQGEPVPESLFARAGELRAFELPRPLLTAGLKTASPLGSFNNRHAAMELKTDILWALKLQNDSKALMAARGQLTPFLRDTLVGLNYAYYEPPGAQILPPKSLFVRSQDFVGETNLGSAQAWEQPDLTGRGGTSNTGPHLTGSLSDLPYVLARVEQDFIAPQNVQALIWEDLVPSLITSATLPRWWRVTPNELHAVSLYQRAGEELLAAAVPDEPLRRKIMDILSDRMLPQRSEQLENALRAGRFEEALARILPAESFYLAAEYRRRFPGENGPWGPAGKELDALSRRDPSAVSLPRLSEDFGVPHPTLASSYNRELLNGKLFPAFSGYSSQLLGESWESSNLYWGRLADEMGYAPEMLNRLVPELTYHMVEEIAATHSEDWPALQRAMSKTGEAFRSGKIASLRKEEAASLPQR